MQLLNIDLKQLRGLTDKAFGLNKELLGTVLGNERLADEGEAQQEKATHELKALRADIKAAAERAEVETQEGRQRAARKVKETSDR
ncbi:MAG: CsbD family protein [Actinomycetota bacterium]|nr:CsbD family protein [Actinomycetota bacterium]